MNEQESQSIHSAELPEEAVAPVHYSEEEVEAEIRRLQSLSENGLHAPTVERGDDSEVLLESAREGARQFIEQGKDIINSAEEALRVIVEEEEISFAEAKRVADESGLSSRLSNLRIKIATTAFAAFTALQVSAAEQGAILSTPVQNEDEQAVTSAERLPTMEDFVKSLYGEDAPPEVSEIFKRVRYAQMYNPKEISVLFYETDNGIESMKDTVGEETSVVVADKERLDRIVAPDVRGVTTIHTHPLSGWSVASQAGSELVTKIHQGETMNEDQLRLAKSLTAVSEEEYNHQEELVREGKLDALPYWPSDIDVLSSVRLDDHVESRGTEVRSMMADGSGVWEISIVPGTPFGDALKIIEDANDELESGLNTKTNEVDTGTLSIEGLREWLASLRKRSSSAHDTIHAISQELVTCTFDITSPYSSEAVVRAERGDTTLAKIEYGERMRFLDTCSKTLLSQGIALNHHPWPQEPVVSEPHTEAQHEDDTDTKQ